VSLRAFSLDGSGSQVITISQEGAGSPITVSLNGRILGTVAAPAEGAANDLTLDDGSILTVRLVKKQVQVRHNGLPLLAASSRKEAMRLLLTKRVMLACAILGPIMGLLSLTVTVSTIMVCFGTHNCTGDSSIFLIFPALLGAGYTLLPLVASIVGIVSALATRRWKWLGFGLGPMFLLQIGFLIWLAFSISNASFAYHVGPILEVFFATAPLTVVQLFSPLGVVMFAPLLASVVCLVYAFRLE